MFSGKFLYWTTFNGKLQLVSDQSGYIIITDQNGNVYKTTGQSFYNATQTIIVDFWNLYYANQVMGITD